MERHGKGNGKMANPNRTVAKFMAKQGRNPKAVEASNARAAASPFVQDMGKFQRGEMTAEEFRAKWEK